MKFWNQARLCLAVYDFEAYIMLSLCLTFQGGKNSTPMRLQSESLSKFSDFYGLVNLVKREYALVSLANAYNSTLFHQLD